MQGLCYHISAGVTMIPKQLKSLTAASIIHKRFRAYSGAAHANVQEASSSHVKNPEGSI